MIFLVEELFWSTRDGLKLTRLFDCQCFAKSSAQIPLEIPGTITFSNTSLIPAEILYPRMNTVQFERPMTRQVSADLKIG